MWSIDLRMHDNSFYHPISKFGSDGGFEAERKLLVERQRLCRARALTITKETNRRRKALEERQKERNEQELRHREKILQLRKQQIQDATERFQRAHLPSCQRRRQTRTFRRNVPNIEEALNEIHGNNRSNTQQSSFLSSSSTLIRSCASSFKAPTVSQSSNLHAPFAVEAHTEALQEGSLKCLRNGQEAKKTQQKQKYHSPQDTHLYQCYSSESLSSEDSLENEDPISQDAKLDLRQQRDRGDGQLNHPSVSEKKNSDKSGNSEKTLFELLPKQNIFLNESETDNFSKEGFPWQIGKENHSLSSQKEPCASINNLNMVSISELKTEKLINKAMLQCESLPNMQPSPLKCLEFPQEDKQKLPLSIGTSKPVGEVILVKGILKKQSKYLSRDATCMHGSRHLIFTKQAALAIRDSVELTKAKTKDVESNIKKKLRWFDEVLVAGEDKERMRATVSNLPKKPDHQPSLTTVSRASKPRPSMTPQVSADYHFTKQAWADVGVQVSLLPDRADEVKALWSSARRVGLKVPWTERSARDGAGLVYPQPRKGTVIRPQSATEMSQIAKNQGKLLLPHPPPRTESVEEKTTCVAKTPYGMDHARVNLKQAPAVEQTPRKDTSEGSFSSYTQQSVRTENKVIYKAPPPSYTCPASEGHAKKGKSSSGHQETRGYGRRRGMVFGENGLCLDCTPTDEQISQLWHGVRRALTSKDGVEGAGQVHLAEVHSARLLERRHVVPVVEAPGIFQKHSQHRGLTSLSMEEQKLLHSLDRLNQQLHCVQEHASSNAAKGNLTKDMQLTNPHKRYPSSANNYARQAKRF